MVRGIVLAVGMLALTACGPSANTTGACKDSIVVGDLEVTEVFADFKAAAGGSGADAGKEWFEIFNASDRPIDLEGLRIDHSRPDGSKLQSHVMTTATVAPGQYFTLGNSTPDLVPAYIDYGYSADLGDMFNADGGKIALNCADSEIDSAIYDTVKEGHSRQLTAATAPDYTLNDDQLNWCEASDSTFEASNFGTPGGDNDCTPVVIGACNDAGVMRPTVSPTVGDLVITEVMPNPAAVADAEGEWFEAKALSDIDLNGLGLDRAGDSSNPNVITSPDCIHVAAGSYMLFAQNADMTMNGNLPAGSVKGTFNFAMIDGTVAAPGDVQIVLGSTVIDAVTWTSTRSGRSHALDPDLQDPSANDAESNFCDGTTQYNMVAALTDFGTPNADNDQCVLLPPAGMCSDAGVNRNIVKPAAGQLVITEVLANPANVLDGTTDAQKEWFELTNTGATAFDLNELILKSPGTTGTPVASAACISVMPAAFALIARSNDPTKNGMLPPPDVTFNFSLVDSGANAGVSVLDGATVLDAVAWTAVGSGLTTALDPDHLNTLDNDVFNVTAGAICRGATAYGDATNKGTPKAANEQCP